MQRNATKQDMVKYHMIVTDQGYEYRVKSVVLD